MGVLHGNGADMTITLAPDPNPRRLDRAQKHRPHVGPFYGHALRRVLEATPPESKRDRDAQLSWLIVVMAVPAAILAAALIVADIPQNIWALVTR